MVPAEREFTIPLEGDSEIRIRAWRDGYGITDFSVQLVTFIGDDYRGVVRYDCEHGRPHRDTLDWEGKTIRKTWMRSGITYNVAMSEAIADLKTNQKRYIEDFKRGNV
ncbi:MAG: hypothetical protein QM692_11000 [Thermomicrobiales bacterium]